MNPTDFDVAILGGGLAGGLLARQLRLQQPQLRVAVLERATTTSFKVGEATVELFGNYLVRKLGLSTYLYEQHLPKNGLRFFCDRSSKDTPLPAMSEIGSKALPYHPTFQLDRARLERDLRTMAGPAGVELLEGAKVTGVSLGEPHQIDYEHGGAGHRLRARWVVDASGRTSILAKQLGLRRRADHGCAAAWARLTDVVDLDGASMPADFRARVRNTSRRLSTVHFVHRGYWIWLIPLRSGVTSVGVVGDPRHIGRAPLRPDGLREFLAAHRAVGELVAPGQWLDFGAHGQLAYGTSRYFGAERYALIGEAAAFTDPYYSPGSDFIALGNDFVCDLIGRDSAGENTAARVELYDRYMQHRFAANLALYRNQYELLGSFELLRARWEFDILCYYHLWVGSYMQDRHLDRDLLVAELRHAGFVVRALERFGALFAAAERELTRRGDYERCNLGHYHEPLAAVDFLTEVGTTSPGAAEDRRTLAIFQRTRQQVFELLGRRPADQGLGFSDYVTGRALALTPGSTA